MIPMMNLQFNTVEDLTYMLINELGLMIGPDNLLYEQETRNLLNMSGKNIKCSVTPNTPVFASEYNMVFDPISNLKLMTMIMGYYFKKSAEAGEFYAITYSIEEVEKRGPSYIRVTLNGNDGSTSGFIQGDAYYNRCLSICDVMLRLSGYPNVNLHNFDVIPNIN